MKKWNLIVDVERCHNSNNCFLSVADEYMDNEHPGYTTAMPKHGHHWINILRNERGQAPMVDVAYVPTMCNHCDDAPCMAAATGDAITKRPDGLVIIDPDKAKGQKQLVESCPYNAIWRNEDLQLPQHWIFDAHLLDDGWKQPRAVSVCATEAIAAKKQDDGDMAKLAEAEGLEVLNPEFGTRPRVYYKNLYRYNKCFIGGSVAVTKDGTSDCVQGASVKLSQGSDVIAEATTDVFGDFKFDMLDENSGAYKVKISADGHASKSVDIELGDSVTLEDIYL